MPASHARFGEICRALRKKALAQVVPPREREAGGVERQVDDERQMRATGGGNRRAEAARDQIAAAGADCPDKSECGGSFDAGSPQGERTAGIAGTFCLLKILLAENRRYHPVSGAVADSGRDKEY